MILINTSQKERKHKGYVIVLATKEMPISITLETHFTTVKMKTIQEKGKLKHSDKLVQRANICCIVVRS